MKLPRTTQNWLTLSGAIIALVSLFMIIFLFVVSTFMQQGHTYLGLVIYIVFPSMLVAGLIMIPVGMVIQQRRLSKVIPDAVPPWPYVDLNKRHHRNAFFIFFSGTVVFMFLTAIGSYEAFHITESVPFCGTLCHEVMKPEYTAYQHSPHARVACVECHVGEGADWYVKSKLSGAYQVYAVLADVYPKPIDTPIANLRPARETCERCHWPEKFYAHKLRKETHYLFDEENTEWHYNLIMKIGAEHSALGLREGIHWHINPKVKIEYIATDERRQEIPWVRYTDLETGEVKIFRDEENLAEGDSLPMENIRVFDCMDCHNRPSHDYQSPMRFINAAITAGKIPKSLPNIKSLAVELSEQEYATTDTAMKVIEASIRSHYDEEYPEIAEEQPELIEQAIAGVQDAFQHNIFPEMKVRWDAYPNDIGHMEFNGCFRCHNDTHESEDGTVISRDCDLCHYINAQGPADNMEYGLAKEALEFNHPDGEEDWKDTLCTDCHTGGTP